MSPVLVEQLPRRYTIRVMSPRPPLGGRSGSPAGAENVGAAFPHGPLVSRWFQYWKPWPRVFSTEATSRGPTPGLWRPGAFQFLSPTEKSDTPLGLGARGFSGSRPLPRVPGAPGAFRLEIGPPQKNFFSFNFLLFLKEFYKKKEIILGGGVSI